MNDSHALMKKIEKILPWCFFLLVLCISVVYIAQHMDCWLDSDMSSEMILGKILSEDNSVLTNRWYYSTELRVLNSQLFYAFFFHFCSDWHLVRLFSNLSMYFVMLLSFYYLCRQLRCARYFPFFAVFLLIPFSTDYFMIILVGGFYIANYYISFLSLGLVFQYAKPEEKHRRLLLAGMFLLALPAGMGGPRLIAVLYLPLLMSSILLLFIRRLPHTASTLPDKGVAADPCHRRFLEASVCSFIGAAAGYLINSAVFPNLYNYKSWSDISFEIQPLSHLGEVLFGFLTSFGHALGNTHTLFTYDNLLCAVLLLSSLWALYHGLRHAASWQNLFIALACLCSLIVFFALYMFTTMDYVARYVLPIIALLLPLGAVSFAESATKENIKVILLSFVVVTAVTCSFLWYKNWSSFDVTLERREIAETLETQGYHEGYAANFWDGNLLTELSDGNLEVWVLSPDAKNIDRLFGWLQPTSHFRSPPQEKTFLLYRVEDLDSCQWKDRLKEDRIIYRSDSYIIYGFENRTEVVADLTDYTADFTDGFGLTDGTDANGVRTIQAGGESVVPRVSLYKGEYHITLTGENLDSNAITLISDDDTLIDIRDLVSGNGSLEYTVWIKDSLNDFAVKVENPTDENVTLTGLTIHCTYAE